MDVGALNRMIAEDAALRRQQALQPVGGRGDKIFPPTYPPSDEAKRANRNARPGTCMNGVGSMGRTCAASWFDSALSPARIKHSSRQ